jgi:hypothetical protein
MRKLLLLTSLFVTIFCFSQTKTKYEQKTEQLTLQLLKDLGIGEYEVNIIKNEVDEGKKTKMFFSRLQSIPNTYENKELLRQYQADLQKAQSLKTKEDFDKENAQKEKIEQQRLLEKTKEENRRQELAKSITNAKVFNTLVETNMNEWLKKGEFEKEDAVNSRIQNEYRSKFQEICENSAIETLDKTTYYISNIGLYNSEKEFFPAELNLITSSGSSNKDATIKKKVNGKIFVSINEAENFKNSFNNKELSIKKFQLQDFKNFTWKLSEDFFIPTEFEYAINNSDRFAKFYKFQFLDDSLQPIIINANNIELQKKENVNFDFTSSINNYASKMRKQIATDRDGYINDTSLENSSTVENKKEDIKGKIKEKAKEEGKKLLKNFGF